MALTKVRGSGAEGLTLSSTALTVANGLTMTDGDIAFADGHGWTYTVVERNWEGSGKTRWFDEILFNEKLGPCRGTGVVELIEGKWKIAHYALTMLVPTEIAADVGSQTQKADKL